MKEGSDKALATERQHYVESMRRLADLATLLNTPHLSESVIKIINDSMFLILGDMKLAKIITD